MNEKDMRFFEEYKRLDKLCGEMLNCSNGVTEYLAVMERSPRGKMVVASWDETYKSLKHIRWVRNRIAHDDVKGRVSEPKDQEFLSAFLRSVETRKDPVSVLRSPKKRGKTAAAGKSRAGKTVLIILGCAVIAAVCGLLLRGRF